MNTATESALMVASALALSLALTWLVRWADNLWGWVVPPRTDRWHRRPTAMHGGVAIWLALLAGILAWWMRARMPTLGPDYWLLAGATLLFATGLIDDHLGLSPTIRIILQAVAASCVIAGAEWLIPLTPWYLVNTLLTYFWFVGVINAVNMLDNMDGLAAGVIAISAAFLAALLVYLEPAMWLERLILLSLVGTLLGYLAYNFSPASVFMGDAGSLVIGFVMAALCVRAVDSLPFDVNSIGAAGKIVTILLPAALVAVPIFDTTLVTVTRKWSGRQAMQGGRDHSSHRLVFLGLSDRTAVLVLYGLSAAGGVVAWSLAMRPAWGILAAGMLALLLTFVGIYLARASVVPAERADKSSLMRLLEVIQNLLVRRKVLAILTDVFLVGSAYYGAFIFRYEDRFTGDPVLLYVHTLPQVIPLVLLWFYLTRMYAFVWRVTSISDVKHYLVTFSGLPFIIVGLYELLGTPYSVSHVLIFDLLLAALVVNSRAFFRIVDDFVSHLARADAGERVPVLIYGAGAGGRIAADEILRNKGQKLSVVGFIDDDPQLLGRKAWGLNVLGTRSDLHKLLDQHGIAYLLVSSPRIDTAALQKELSQLPNPPTILTMDIVWKNAKQEIVPDILEKVQGY